MGAEVTVRRKTKFENEVQIGRHRVPADEPESVGGTDKGPDPYGFLLAALGSCISVTVTMYAERKGWPLEGIEVNLRHDKIHVRDCEDCIEGVSKKVDRIEKSVVFTGPLDDEQLERLRDISTKCPVHRTLTQSVQIVEA